VRARRADGWLHDHLIECVLSTKDAKQKDRWFKGLGIERRIEHAQESFNRARINFDAAQDGVCRGEIIGEPNFGRDIC
jgi:hypothetical protein